MHVHAVTVLMLSLPSYRHSYVVRVFSFKISLSVFSIFITILSGGLVARSNRFALIDDVSIDRPVFQSRGVAATTAAAAGDDDDEEAGVDDAAAVAAAAAATAAFFFNAAGVAAFVDAAAVLLSFNAGGCVAGVVVVGAAAAGLTSLGSVSTHI